jgi:hypothetical protein
LKKKTQIKRKRGTNNFVDKSFGLKPERRNVKDARKKDTSRNNQEPGDEFRTLRRRLSLIRCLDLFNKVRNIKINQFIILKNKKETEKLNQIKNTSSLKFRIGKVMIR